jgi:zinc protease
MPADHQPNTRSALAGSPLAGRRERGLSPTRHVLPNGLTVLAKETRTTPAVTIHAGFHGGAAYDPPDLAGLAHFVSKTIDRGTESRSADQIAEALDSRGVSLTIAVNRHAMWLICTCLSEDFERILALVGDIAIRPAFPAGEVETRRGEIITLLRQDQDNPATVAMETMMRALYGEAHAYGRPMRGTLETVERITTDDLRRFHRARFSPQSLSLALVGDVEADRAVAATASVFGEWQADAPAAMSFGDVEPARERRATVLPMMNKAQADVAYGFVTIRRGDPRYYAYWVMNNILGQYALGGRLGDSIRERQGMAYYTFSSFDASVAPGPLVVRAGVSPANVQRAVTSIDLELSRFAADGPADRELAESKQYLIGSMPRTLETNVGIATFLQTAELFGLGLDYDLRLPALLAEVSRDQVHEAARATLDPSRATVVVAGPYAGALQ